MGIYHIQPPRNQIDAPTSLLSDVALHFEYDKKITQVRAALHAKQQ